MRVLLVSSYSYPHSGGMSSHISDLVDGLASVQVEAEVWARPEATTGRLVKSLPLAVRLARKHGWGAWRYAARVAVLTHVLRSAEADIYHAHDPLAAWALAMAGREPLISTSHGPLVGHALETGERDRATLAILSYAERVAADASDVYIAVDRGQASLLERHGACPVVVPNAVDVSAFGGGAPISLSTTGRPYFCLARRLVPKNGVDVAIRALAQSEDFGFDLVIAGDGPERARLENLAAELDVGSRCHFLGAIPRAECVRLMQRAIASVVPSVPVGDVVEATSIAALEGLASGTPVVASRIGGLADIDPREEHILYFEAGNPRELSRIFKEIRTGTLSDSAPDSRRAYVVNHFGTERWTDRHVTLYESAQLGRLS